MGWSSILLGEEMWRYVREIY